MKYNKNFYQIKSNTEIFEKIKSERDGEEVGYYNLPYQDTTEIKDYAVTITKKHVVVKNNTLILIIFLFNIFVLIST